MDAHLHGLARGRSVLFPVFIGHGLPCHYEWQTIYMAAGCAARQRSSLGQVILGFFRTRLVQGVVILDEWPKSSLNGLQGWRALTSSARLPTGCSWACHSQQMMSLSTNQLEVEVQNIYHFAMSLGFQPTKHILTLMPMIRASCSHQIVSVESGYCVLKQ